MYIYIDDIATYLTLERNFPYIEKSEFEIENLQLLAKMK